MIANQLNLNYTTEAKAGYSNSAIARTVIQYAQKSSLNVIQWTWIDRSEYLRVVTDDWEQIRPSDDRGESKYYYKYLHSELQDKWINLNIIVNTLKHLEDNNIPYVCHVLDQLLLDQRFHNPPYIKTLQAYLAPRIVWFPGHTTFFEWAKLEKFPISEAWHPLEQAHEEAAKIWQSTYEQYCK